VLLEVEQEVRPISWKAVRVEVFDGERETVVDADDGRGVRREFLAKPFGKAPSSPVPSWTGRRLNLFRRADTLGGVNPESLATGFCGLRAGVVNANVACEIWALNPLSVTSIPGLLNPIQYFIRDRESLPRTRLEPRPKPVSMNFERDAIVSATSEKTLYVQFCEARNSKSPILLDMYEFMEQEPVGERHMRYDHIRECNRGHLAKIWQVREPHFRQHRIERGICDSVPIEVDNSDAVEEMR
jgi:hypothetical protein